MKFRRTVWAWLLAAVIALALLGIFLQRPHNLIEHASRAAQFDGTGSMGKFDGWYRWLNDREILFQQFDGSQVHLMRQRTDPPAAAVEIKLAGFNSFSASVAPDGRRLCWVSFERRADKPVRVVKASAITDTDIGSSPTVYELPNSDGFLLTDFCWSPDNRSLLWLLQDYHGGPAIHQLFLETGRHTTWSLPWKEANGEIDFHNLRLSRVLADNRALVNCDSRTVRQALLAPDHHRIANQPGYYFASFNPAKPLDHPTEWIAPDEGADETHSTVASLTPSPQADRLLWTTVKQVHRPWEAMLARLHLGPPVRMHWLVRFEVSDMQGKGRHEIASGEIGNADRYTGDAKWMPDGKRISFVYHGGLYLLPVH